MDKFTRYLKDVWSLTQAQFQPKKAAHLNVVMGNVSGDMDSVVCSILLGYYLTYKHKFYEETKEDIDPENVGEEQIKKFHVPILNMNKVDLDARSDIIMHLENVGVDHKHIPAYDEIDVKHYAENGALGVSLVDHNFPDYTQEYMIPHVEYIYDHHHEKEAEYPNLKFKDIRFCGSAGTLVAKALLEDEDWKDELVDETVAWFASAPILIDTVNFKEAQRGKKWDQVDEDTFKLVKAKAGDKIPENYFRTLYEEKTDPQKNVDLGFHLLQRKDYKNYKMGDLILGISTMFIDLRTCVEKFGGDNMIEEFNKILDERNLSMYMILTHYEENHDVRRQVLTYSRDKDLADKLISLFDHLEVLDLEEMKLDKLEDNDHIKVWQNHSTSYSRKKIEPHIRKHFE